MYENGARDFFDVLGSHPYGFAYPPDDPHGAHDGLNFARLTDIRHIMVQYDDSDKPVWATEVGWITEPAPESKLWQQVTLEEQAKYLVGAFRSAAANWPWLELFVVWNLSVASDPPDIAGYSIVNRDDAPRPAFEALVSAEKPLQVYRSDARVPMRATQVIAPDVVVHLGDSLTVNPGWSPLYCESEPCREWQGYFYVPESLLDSNRDQTLTLRIETMQVEEQGNLVHINSRPLSPHAIPPRPKPDFTTAWTTTEMMIPANTLTAGLNTIHIMASPRLVPFQTGIRFESLQIRNIQIAVGHHPT
jgi:hypothetical protein